MPLGQNDGIISESGKKSGRFKHSATFRSWANRGLTLEPGERPDGFSFKRTPTVQFLPNQREDERNCFDERRHRLRVAFPETTNQLYMNVMKQESVMIRAAIAILFLSLAAIQAAATEAGWALLREGGQVVLISHANALGHDEPANFDLESCATQRNLSDRGREQARRMGALFFARAAPIDAVLSSRYCRAYETATLAFGDAEILDALDNFEPGSDAAKVQIPAIQERIRSYTGAGNLVMVTHPDVIEAVTGARPRDAEAIIVSRSKEPIGVAARITFN